LGRAWISLDKLAATNVEKIAEYLSLLRLFLGMHVSCNTEKQNFPYHRVYVGRGFLARIPLIEDLTSEPVPPGSNILVEFDPASKWYAASVTIAAGWLRTGGRVHYNVTNQPPEGVRSQLSRLGLEVRDLERTDRLRIYDWYSLTLGGKSREKAPAPSLKVSELSPVYSSWIKSGELGENANTLRVMDNGSTLTRFNDEKMYVEFILTRVFPRGPVWKATLISPLVRGLHSDLVYKALEAGADAVIDFKLDEAADPARSLMRIRNFRGVHFDGKWHTLTDTRNFEVKLAT
jgi:KaiC/GvpD/RAD55 family RecA-like ATPase